MGLQAQSLLPGGLSKLPQQSDNATLPAKAKRGFVRGPIEVRGIDNPALKRRLVNAIRQGTDSMQTVAIAQKSLIHLRQLGYAEAKIDSLSISAVRAEVIYSMGPLYYVKKVEAAGVPPSAIEAAGLLTSDRPDRPLPFEWQRVEIGMVRMLQEFENDGYPFAAFVSPEVQYTKESSNKVGVSISLKLNQGSQVVLDSVIPVGRIREKHALVHGLTRLRPGQLYSQSALDAAPTLLNNSLYYQNAKPPIVTFRKRGERYAASVRLPVEQRRSNRFDAIIGFLPPQAGQSQFSFTALIDLQLVSALRQGELIAFKYDELPNGARKVDLRYLQPGLFGTPFKVEFKFNLQRQDTLWLTRSLEPAFYYAFNAQLSAKLFYQNLESNLISTKAFGGASPSPLSIINGRSDLYGLGVQYEALDYRPNPRKGFTANFDLSTGRKNLFRPPGVDTAQFKLLTPSQARTEARVEAWAYRPVGKRTVLVGGARGYWLGLDEYVQNDLTFMGGTRSLRGFNENQFQANAYGIGTIEYRLLLDKDSYLGVFADYGYLETRTLLTRQVLHPWGVGFTLSLKTQAGLVSVSYGVGQSELQNFQPANGRIHIGYSGIF